MATDVARRDTHALSPFSGLQAKTVRPPAEMRLFVNAHSAHGAWQYVPSLAIADLPRRVRRGKPRYSEFRNVQRTADHQGAGKREQQHQRVQLPWTDGAHPKPELVADRTVYGSDGDDQDQRQ